MEQTEIDWNFEISEIIGWEHSDSPVMEAVDKFIKHEYTIDELIKIYAFGQQLVQFEQCYDPQLYGYLCFVIVAHATIRWFESIAETIDAPDFINMDSLINAVWYNYYPENDVTLQLLEAAGIDYETRLNNPEFDSVMDHNDRYQLDDRKTVIENNGGDIDAILENYGLEVFISPKDYGTYDLVEMRVALLNDIRDQNPDFVLRFK